jgi:hypothetical protein
MDHGDARRLMAKSLETKLGRDEERDLALHLVGCAECKRLYAGLQHAHPALASLAPGSPPADAIDRAVLRSTTVLRGEADPGPIARQGHDHPTNPDAFTDDYRPGPIVIHPPAAPPEPEPEVGLDEVEWDESPGAVRPTEADEPSPRIVEQPPALPVEDEPTVAASSPTPFEPEPLDELPPPPPPIEREVPPAADPTPPVIVQPRSEIEELLEEERRRLEPLPYTEEEEADAPRTGMWLIAIAVTVAIAVIALVLVTKGQKLLGSSTADLPKPSDVEGRVARAFTDMKSLKASFDIERLSLYRVDTKDNAAVYSFGNGTYRGNIVYDRAEGYRQAFTLKVGGRELSRATVVQSADQTQSVIGRGATAAYVIEKRPPLGPPDGALRPSLGLLEDAIGTVPAMLSTASDVKVVAKSQKDGRDLYEVRFSVKPSELTRADQIDVFVDAENYVPMIVRRSISRDNAGVLGPGSALTPSVLDRAFGKNTRVTTEVAQLSNVVKDDIILPGDFALNPPPGLKAQTSDGNFEQITQAELSTKLDFKPLFPTSLPSDFQQAQLAVYRGKPAAWGPNNSFPAPKNVFQEAYFNGATTIVITEKQMSTPFDITTSPLQASLPITVRTVNRGTRTFYYGTSPEVPPHAFGFIGNTFVMASGYAPEAELIKALATLQEQAVTVPPLLTVSPGSSLSPAPSSSASGGALPGD